MFLQIIQLHRTGVTVQAIVRQVSLSFLLVLGRYLNDVRKIFGVLDPSPPLCHAFTQPISTVLPQNWAILEPPPLERDVIYGWSLS